MNAIDTMIVKHEECGFTGTIAAVALHSCTIFEQGGRCEDYPCCGHTDGDGCQTLPSHTADFYYRNPHLLHEPGSPEWYDAMGDFDGEEDGDVTPCDDCGQDIRDCGGPETHSEEAEDDGGPCCYAIVTTQGQHHDYDCPWKDKS